MPAGEVTFLFTDIVDSSGAWERHPDAMSSALVQHDHLIGTAVTERGGDLFKHTGDGVCAAFSTPADAVGAAVDAQLALRTADWGELGTIAVRMAVHTGSAEHRSGDYFGLALSRAARLKTMAYGNQVLVSAAARAAMPPGGVVALVSLGEHSIRGLREREQVFQACHPDLPAAFPLLDDDRRTPGNVPAATAPLVGRVRELVAISDALSAARLVTLTGLAGVGKTRLALAAAALETAQSPDGVWWCDLTPISDPHAIGDAVLAALGAPAPLGRPIEAGVAAAIGDRAMLVVLDNCEQVLDGVAALATRILGDCPHTRLMLTSREPLDIPGEHTLIVEPLPPPSRTDAPFATLVANPAVAMFAERARAAGGLAIRPADAAHVAEICRRLDGLPLALELAAAKTRTMSPAQLEAHLDGGLRLLARPAHGDPRHASMEAAIQWSYDLLDPAEAALFDELSVLAGGFDLQTILGLGGSVDALDGLVRKSMVSTAEVDGNMRFHVLESLRSFGHGRLVATGNDRVVSDRHAAYFTALASAAAAGLKGPDEQRWVATINGALADLRCVHTRAVETGDLDTALRLVADLGFAYAFFRMRGEIGAWAAQAASMPGAREHPLFGVAAGVAADLAWVSGDFGASEQWGAAGAVDPTAWTAHDALGNAALFTGQPQTAMEHAVAAVGAAELLADGYLGCISLSHVAFYGMFSGRTDVVAFAQRAERLAAEIGNPTLMAHAAWTTGTLLFDRDPLKAMAEFERCIALAGEVGNVMDVGAASTSAEQLRHQHSTDADALRGLLDQIDYWVRVDNATNLWGPLRGLARRLARSGRHADAAVLLGAERAAEFKLPLLDTERPHHERAVQMLVEALGPRAYAAAVERGAAMDRDTLAAHARRAVDDCTDAST